MCFTIPGPPAWRGATDPNFLSKSNKPSDLKKLKQWKHERCRFIEKYVWTGGNSSACDRRYFQWVRHRLGLRLFGRLSLFHCQVLERDRIFNDKTWQNKVKCYPIRPWLYSFFGIISQAHRFLTWHGSMMQNKKHRMIRYRDNYLSTSIVKIVYVMTLVSLSVYS